jgi:hypothetical protein
MNDKEIVRFSHKKISSEKAKAQSFIDELYEAIMKKRENDSESSNLRQ